LESIRFGLFEWCRGPESNWLRPPFQGGALPLSYPGNCGLEIVWGAARLCQFVVIVRTFSTFMLGSRIRGSEIPPLAHNDREIFLAE
jgi:hypothetical protein